MEFIDVIKEPILTNQSFVLHDVGRYNNNREIFDKKDGLKNEAKEKTKPIDIF